MQTIINKPHLMTIKYQPNDIRNKFTKQLYLHMHIVNQMIYSMLTNVNHGKIFNWYKNCNFEMLNEIFERTSCNHYPVLIHLFNLTKINYSICHERPPHLVPHVLVRMLLTCSKPPTPNKHTLSEINQIMTRPPSFVGREQDQDFHQKTIKGLSLLYDPPLSVF